MMRFLKMIVAVLLSVMVLPAHGMKDDVIPIFIPGETVPTGHPHAPALQPIQAYWDQTAESVLLVFSYDVGTVSVTLENLSTGEFDSSSVSGTDTKSFPISATSGTWRLTITLSGGRVYCGEFEL